VTDDGVPLDIEAAADAVTVVRAEDRAPVLIHHVPAGARPFLHPIQAPGGAGVITEDAPPHHPWQHGLYIGLNDVNGAGFWSEGLDPRRAAIDGTFDPVIESAGTEDGVATWAIRTRYLANDGTPVFDDRQSWSAQLSAGLLVLDLTWSLGADHEVVFGAYDYGGLFLRMPFRADAGGHAESSEGTSADGQRARWVAVRMPLPDTGREVSVAMLDHPGNPGSPVTWRIDGELGICPSPSIAGQWSIPAGEQATFRYRLAVFGDLVTPETIDAVWRTYAGEAA
jgi:hypothetical protein